MDLVEFLTARLGEDERIARAAATLRGGGEWAAKPDPEGVIAVTGLPEAWQSYVPVVLNPDDDETAIHIARHDPARVLAEVDAKRRMLDEHVSVNGGDCGTCVKGHWGYPTHGGSSPERWPCPTLRLLALPHADHPDYDEAWRP